MTSNDAAIPISDLSRDVKQANLSDLDDDPGHVFDQTNGIVEGLGGDDDGRVDDSDGGGLLLDPILGEDSNDRGSSEENKP